MSAYSKRATNQIVFPPGGKVVWLANQIVFPPRGENDLIGWESFFVFKTVVPKHRFCKLQNVWNVCEFGSDYTLNKYDPKNYAPVSWYTKLRFYKPFLVLLPSNLFGPLATKSKWLQFFSNQTLSYIKKQLFHGVCLASTRSLLYILTCKIWWRFWIFVQN